MGIDERQQWLYDAISRAIPYSDNPGARITKIERQKRWVYKVYYVDKHGWHGAQTMLWRQWKKIILKYEQKHEARRAEVNAIFDAIEENDGL